MFNVKEKENVAKHCLKKYFSTFSDPQAVRHHARVTVTKQDFCMTHFQLTTHVLYYTSSSLISF